MQSIAPTRQAPIRNLQTKKGGSAKVRNRQMIGRPGEVSKAVTNFGVWDLSFGGY